MVVWVCETNLTEIHHLCNLVLISQQPAIHVVWLADRENRFTVTFTVTVRKCEISSALSSQRENKHHCILSADVHIFEHLMAFWENSLSICISPFSLPFIHKIQLRACTCRRYFSFDLCLSLHISAGFWISRLFMS